MRPPTTSAPPNNARAFGLPIVVKNCTTASPAPSSASVNR
jgi:hypothetical protein